MLINKLKELIQEDPLREEIDLSNQAISILDNNSVDLLSRFQNLKFLNLSDNYLQKLPNNMDLLKKLEFIDLNGNPFQEVELAVESIKQIGSSLTNLNINLFEEDQVDFLLRNLEWLQVLNGLKVERDALFNDIDEEEEDYDSEGNSQNKGSQKQGQRKKGS